MAMFLGALEDLRVVGVSDETRALVNNLVEQNLTWANIKNLIRLDRSMLRNIIDGTNVNIPDAMRITYQTVYYAMKECMKTRY
jgi:hypothetical protein